ncbi:hypothetical protein K432DRAFT_436813 [Lepidopterella palustris CBS 459.81]|uniref:Uncharacterized protein n=1 Tax=Lepidopterella palustris CBS 459.81 TaxID=1314670 RepID=A0A8E2E3T7_9PEZI|nr:hypothetical protein K432DRAFT_436813 [Lepidopterella palustris CBS 459.81]
MASSERVAIVTGTSLYTRLGTDEDLSRVFHETLAKELGDGAKFLSEMFQKVWEKWGRINALCANVGIVDRNSIYIFGHCDSDKEPDLSCTHVDCKGIVNKISWEKIVMTVSIAALYLHESYLKSDGANAAVLNLVRPTTHVLKIKETITNEVLPGIVHRNIIAQMMVDAISLECMTPISTIITAYNKFLDDGSLCGKAVQRSGEKLFSWRSPIMCTETSPSE